MATTGGFNGLQPRGVLHSCCIRSDCSVREAMQVIDACGIGIALVVDDEGRLEGTLTDGNIRRAILNAATLDMPVRPHANPRYISVGPQVSRAEVVELMQARYISQIPVVDDERRLLGLHLLHEILGAVEKPNWAVVMAGGRGTRLHPITETMPKPMIKVAGRPILERLILHLISFGIRHVFLAINYLGHIVEDHFGNGSRFGCNIEYLRESEPLGTAGPLALLPTRPDTPLLVLNGDLVTQLNVDHLLQFHQAGGYAATLCLRRYLHQIPFGVVDTDGPRVVTLAEKPVIEKFINAGVYVLDPAMLGRVPPRFATMTGLFDEIIADGHPVGALEIEDDWLDVGRFETLKAAREGTNSPQS